MNTFDVILLALACALILLGVIKGLVRILFGVAALVAAFALAARYHEGVAGWIAGWEIALEPSRLIAYLAIFLAVMLAGGCAAWLGRKLVKAAMLGWADRLGGAAVGLLAAALLAALVVLPLVAYSPYGERWLARSVLAPYVTAVADLANRVAPEDLSERYRRRVEDLRRHWRDERDADPRPQA